MAAGYDQILWLYWEEMQVTEAGTMNFFVRWTNKEGKEELVTAPLDGTILPGVTRQALLDLCREWGEFDVTERVYTMDELVEAIEDGQCSVTTPIPVHFFNKKNSYSRTPMRSVARYLCHFMLTCAHSDDP